MKMKDIYTSHYLEHPLVLSGRNSFIVTINVCSIYDARGHDIQDMNKKNTFEDKTS